MYDDPKREDGPKKPIIAQLAELVGAAAGALAEGAVKSVAKRVTRTATEKTPRPVKKAVKTAGSQSLRMRRSIFYPRRVCAVWSSTRRRSRDRESLGSSASSMTGHLKSSGGPSGSTSVRSISTEGTTLRP